MKFYDKNRELHDTRADAITANLKLTANKPINFFKKKFNKKEVIMEADVVETPVEEVHLTVEKPSTTEDVKSVEFVTPEPGTNDTKEKAPQQIQVDFIIDDADSLTEEELKKVNDAIEECAEQMRKDFPVTSEVDYIYYNDNPEPAAPPSLPEASNEEKESEGTGEPMEGVEFKAGEEATLTVEDPKKPAKKKSTSKKAKS